jgi:hypothetical protein
VIFLLLAISLGPHRHVPKVGQALSRVADPHHFCADPDPYFHFNEDPVPDPTVHCNADPDPAHHQSFATLRLASLQALRDSIMSL